MLSRFVLRGASAALLALTLSTGSAGAANTPATTVRIAKIPISGNPLKAFDISWVDPVIGRYYLADRSNGAVDIFDENTNELVAQVGGFVGAKKSNDVSGPDGVVGTFSGKELWAGDGDSTVKVIDLTVN